MPAQLPAAVARQAEQAETMSRTAANQGQQPTATPASQDTGNQPPQAPTATPAHDAARPEDQAQPQNLQQRFDTLQGKYNAEIPRLNQAMQDLTGRLNAANQQIVDLQNENRQLRESAATKAPEGDTPSGGQILDPNAFEAYGPEFVQMANVLQDVLKTNRDTAHKVETFTAQTATSKREAFEKSLTDAVADWRALNFDNGFIAWLQVVPPGETRTRIQMLRERESALDHAGCAKFFNDYKSEHPFQQPPPAPRQPDISRQFTPDSSGGAGESAPDAAKRTWTRAQIKQFFRDKAEGRYNGTLGTPEQAAVLERDIHLASAEGRVVG
jgi:hypothetical protein